MGVLTRCIFCHPKKKRLKLSLFILMYDNIYNVQAQLWKLPFVPLEVAFNMWHFFNLVLLENFCLAKKYLLITSQQFHTWFCLEHPFPFLPWVKLYYSHIFVSARGSFLRSMIAEASCSPCGYSSLLWHCCSFHSSACACYKYACLPLLPEACFCLLGTLVKGKSQPHKHSRFILKYLKPPETLHSQLKPVRCL